jgi:FkbM family methyltransferase
MYNKMKANEFTMCETIEMHAAAAYVYDGNITFYEDKRSSQQWGSSIVKRPDMRDRQRLEYNVPSIDIVQVINELSTSAQVTLKVDIEGAEYALLEHVLKNTEALRRIAYVFVEWHGRYMPKERDKQFNIERKLREHGIQLQEKPENEPVSDMVHANNILHTRRHRHILTIGDSVSRYRYLDMVFRHHFHAERTPEYMLNEKLHSSWDAFFMNTTNTFNGHMICDCSRQEQWPEAINSMFEIRRYTSPHSKLIMSYIQWFGQVPLRFRLSREDALMSLNIIPGLKTILSQMKTPPTHVVMNAGLWQWDVTHSEFSQLFHDIRTSGAQPFWVETHSIVANRKCPRTRWTSVYSCDKHGDEIARHYQNGTFFIPFLLKTSGKDYWDGVHFHAPLYKRWNLAIQKYLN